MLQKVGAQKEQGAMNSAPQWLHQYKDVLNALSGIRRGIEKEGVRTAVDGNLSQHAHPQALGAALTHPNITTDFAEAQLELVTPAYAERGQMFDHLSTLHGYVANNLSDSEVMWGASMPPRLPSEEAIAIADYGHSNVGQMKQRYRHGLANRYGKKMQTISGIHYNFSLPETFWQALHQVENSPQPLSEFISDRYFHMIRNIMRHGWIIGYLFGASPAVDSSYLVGKQHDLDELDFGIADFGSATADNHRTYYAPWATSLRLSNLGYSNSEQSKYALNYNNKHDYLSGLYNILAMPSEYYAQFEQNQQVNNKVLQLENELYSSVRPKIVNDELRPLYAMCRYGVEYIELRSLDINPYLPLGLDQTQSYFLDLFLLYCALSPSAALDVDEQAVIQQRQECVAMQGRKPQLTLPTLEGEQPLKTLGLNLLADMEALLPLFEDQLEAAVYAQSVEREKAKLFDASLTPSARVLADMLRDNLSYTDLLLGLSQAHARQHQLVSKTTQLYKELTVAAKQSLELQQEIEANDTISFDDYLQQKTALTYEC
ncbi:glutamate--cysteine ligase [Photobacterium sanguinicancri]|uniref:Glutamate--cysteine ligase n=1 Tax=Photobacterium sanguinicancri TaxID=875932 RepID=A0AAW7YCE2_9GAMM|nr:glutamate--cysteine ligase [Photobacterium sanguinicancri]MDO6544667.1 glutamate--cysteine ligase [Photobacterium sanguinicancri]